jgi:hypothetical protein
MMSYHPYILVGMYGSRLRSDYFRPLLCFYPSYAGRLLSSDMLNVSGSHREAIGKIRLGIGYSWHWSRFVTLVLRIDAHVVGLAIMVVVQLRSGNWRLVCGCDRGYLFWLFAYAVIICTLVVMETDFCRYDRQLPVQEAITPLFYFEAARFHNLFVEAILWVCTSVTS